MTEMLTGLGVPRTLGSTGGGRQLAMLVTSAGRRVALLQAFRRAAVALDVDLELIACDLDPEWSAACQIADHRFAVPPADHPEYADAILAACRERGIGLVVPTIDPELLPLADHSAQLCAIGTELAASGPKLIAMARDKLATARFLEDADVPTPRTRMLSDLRAAPGAWRWPVMVKPRHGSASRSITIVQTPDELPASDIEPMIAQDLLTGTEWTVNMYFDGGGQLRAVVPHRRVRVRAGEVEKGVTGRLPVLVALAHRIAAALPDPRGALCFQAMVAADGSASVFEINARFGGGYPLADQAGASFARWLIEERVGLRLTANDHWSEGVAMLRYDAAVFVAPCD